MATRDHHDGEDQRRSSRRRSSPSLTAARAAGRAAHAVHELTGRHPESVVSIEKQGSGWCVGIEVIEAHRIPDSADVLAVYEAQLDSAGHLQSYRRTKRYLRGRTEGGT